MNEQRLRDLAETRLISWAHSRSLALELAGGTGASVSEIIRERAQGGSASTAPNQLTGPEARAAAAADTLQTEQSFRSLPGDQRSLVGWVYLRERSVSSWGEAHDKGNPQRVMEKALLAVGRDLVYGDEAAAGAGRERRIRKDEKGRGLPALSLRPRGKRRGARKQAVLAVAADVLVTRRRNSTLGLTSCDKHNKLPLSLEKSARTPTPEGPA